MLALQGVHRRELGLCDHVIEAVRAEEGTGILRERGEHRADKRVTSPGDVDDLLLRDLDRREVLEDDDTRARRVARDNLAGKDIAGLRGPWGRLRLLAGDAECRDEPAVAAFDDEVLEERKQVGRHLRESVLDEEGRDLGPLISLKLDNLTHLLVFDKSTVTGKFLGKKNED